MKYTYDFLVIGSGLAGLSFALKVADFGKVGIVTKTEMEITNTSLAQGGIAGVIYNPDDKERHIEDTMNAGAYLNDREVVKIVVDEAKEQIEELIQWGTKFDKKSDGTYDLAKEGGHSGPRILHHKDKTGAEIQRALVEEVRQHKNIDIFEYHFGVDLITQHHLGQLVKRSFTNIKCFGAYVLDIKTDEVHTFLAPYTFLATGGVGNIYQTTTNPPIATGDGMAMAYRAKAYVNHMEFIQFHPTALYNPGESPSFLISEALRGFGAVLRDHKGEQFALKYDARGSLAPRDIVARAIDKEIKQSGKDYVFLDCTHLNSDQLVNHFPNIYNKCLSLDIDITKQFIPVIPAAHYICGGITIDKNGETSINNLYAGGEVACSGLHGANRLASNSLLEAVVFANRAAKHILAKTEKPSVNMDIPEWNDEGMIYPEEMVLITQNWKELQQIMTNYVGIVRSDLRLKRALARLEIIYHETLNLYHKTTVSKELCELRNAVNVAYLIIKFADAREKSIGLHYNIDHI